MKFIPCLIAVCLLTTPLSAADSADDPGSQSSQPVAVATKSEAAVTVPAGKADRIVVYSASWCSPCKRLKPVILALKQEGYCVEYQDIDRDSDKLKYAYQAVPTIYFLSGNEVIKKTTGYRSRQQITDTLIRDSRVAPAAPVEPAIVWR